jgi:SSS family solute:Na+ symporter
MSLNSMIVSGFFIYFTALLIYIYYHSKKISEDTFVIGGRKVGVIGTLSSTAVSIRDGGGIIFWIGSGYVLGYAGLWLIFGLILGYLTYPFFVHKVRQEAKEKNYITIGNLVRERLGEKTAKTISTIILIFAILVASIQLYVIGNLFSQVTSFDPTYTVLISALIVGLYLSWGGYESVVKTDIIQFFIIFAMILAVFTLPLKSENVFAYKSLFSDTFNNSAWLFVLGFFYAFCSPDVWQRIFSAKDDKTVKIAFPLVGPVILILTLSLLFIGMAGKGLLNGDVTTGNAFAELFSQHVFSDYFMVFLFVVMVSICMSTLDSMTYVFSSTIQEDIFKENVKKEHSKYIKLSKIIMILFLIVSCILALAISDIINYLFSSFTVIVVLTPLFIGVATGKLRAVNKNTDTIIAWGLGLCTIAHILMFTFGILDNNQWFQIASAVVYSVFVITYAATHRINGRLKKRKAS